MLRNSHSSPVFYEVIRQSHAAKLYLDLEFQSEPNREASGDVMTNAVISTCFALAGVTNPRWSGTSHNDDNGEDVVVLDSTTEKKFSRHLTFTKIEFHDNVQMGEFVSRVVCDMIEKDRNNMMVFKDGSKATNVEQVPFVDLGVYTRNRCFRLIGSSKFGKTARFIFPNRKGLRVSVSEKEFLRSLVCNVECDQKLLGNPRPPACADGDGRCFKRARTSAGLVAGTGVGENASSPYKKIG